jgi:hypothetical protein
MVALPFQDMDKIQLFNAHSSGIPALRRPSFSRSFISTKRASPLWDIQCAFHAAIVLSGPGDGSAR